MMRSTVVPGNKAFLGDARLRTLVYKLYQGLHRGPPRILLDQAGRGKATAVSLFSPINLSAHIMDVKEIRLSLRAKFWFHLLLYPGLPIWSMLC